RAGRDRVGRRPPPRRDGVDRRGGPRIAGPLLDRCGDRRRGGGAIVGDNVGYWLGRKGGRTLLARVPLVRDHFERVLPPSERFFERHGSKTVFIARFFAVLRVTAAWLAGISRMPWWRFLLWNAAGGIVWAVVVGLIAYEVGRAAADAISRYGLDRKSVVK